MARVTPAIAEPVRPERGGLERFSRLYTAGLDGKIKRDVTHLVESSTFRYQWGAEVEGSIDANLIDVGAARALEDMIIPEIELRWTDRYGTDHQVIHQPGRFYFKPSPRRSTRELTMARINGRDTRWMLGNLVSDQLYWIRPTEYYSEAIRRVFLANNKWVKFEVPAMPTKPSKDRGIRPNANLLRFADDAALASNFWNFSSLHDGTVTTFPKLPLSKSEPARIIDSRLGDVISDTFDFVPDSDQFCNLVILASNDPQADLTMREGYQLRLDDPNDPFSIPRIGPYPKIMTDNRDESFDGMRQRALVLMEEGYGAFTRITMAVWPDPRFTPREPWQVHVEDDNGNVLVDGMFRLESTEFGLTGDDVAQVVTLSYLADLSEVV